MVRLMCIPLIAFVLFAGLMAAIVGAVDLLSVVTNWFDQQRIQDSAASVGLGLAEIVAVIILFVGMVPILAVLYIKSIYLAAVDVFRADDAHPLLAPFATTVAAWSLAGIGYFTGGPTGVSYDLGSWILVLVPRRSASSMPWTAACCGGITMTLCSGRSADARSDVAAEELLPGPHTRPSWPRS